LLYLIPLLNNARHIAHWALAKPWR
jgi:hypothetical protein